MCLRHRTPTGPAPSVVGSFADSVTARRGGSTCVDSVSMRFYLLQVKGLAVPSSGDLSRVGVPHAFEALGLTFDDVSLSDG